MDGFSWSLVAASAGVALTHTLLGPDHYLPFLMLARARRWTRARTMAITVACGAGHVASSLLLGAAGVMLGVAAAPLAHIEQVRGGLAAWALVIFGAAYFLWGVRRAVRRARDLEPHAHGDHVHMHAGSSAAHAHRDADAAAAPRSATTFWVLFTIFVLGPCEPMIPLFVLPASRGRWGLAIGSALLFSVLTIATMVVVTLLSLAGLRRLPFAFLERWSHAMAGAVLWASGLAIITLGL
ncbi:MAG: sulfite exporter TauE/SafE family protein [Candidatus Polarisedimenticolia bacterium]